MTGRRAARTAGIVGLVILLVVGVFPYAAGTLAGNALHRELREQFPGSLVTVSVEGLSAWGAVRGDVPLVYIGIAGWEAEADGEPLEVDALDIELRDVRVDVGAALSGALGEVEVGQGTFIAAISTATLTRLLRDGLERERPDLRPVAVEVLGANLLVTSAGLGGEPLSVEVRPALLENRVVLFPLGVRDDDPARLIADAIAGLGGQLPAPPFGLSWDELVVASGGAALRGELFGQTVDLS